MKIKLKLVYTGPASVGLTIPAQLLTATKVKAGDEVVVEFPITDEHEDIPLVCPREERKKRRI